MPYRLLALVLIMMLAACDRATPRDSSANQTSRDGNATGAAASSSTGSGPAIEVVDQVVEIACGECQFDMEGLSCDLAVRIDGKSYFVDGFSIDDFGDAHAADGLCNAVRQARISGRIEGERFIATEIEPVSDSEKTS